MLRRGLRGARTLVGAVLELNTQQAASNPLALATASSAPSTSASCTSRHAAALQSRVWLSHAAVQHVATPHTYTLTITTGNLRGAGSLTPAWVQLVGTQGKSERIIVGDTEEDSLGRGTVRTVTVTVSEDLGQLRFVNVQRLGSSISDAGTGWYLEHVVVATPERRRLVFPCHAWFGEADCGGMRGPLERNLLPVSPEDSKERGEPVRIVASGLAVPHPDKVKNDGIKGVNRKGYGHGGEDSYFYCEGKNHVFAMGVADGVFMWREQGIDSGDFSRALMRLSEASVLSGSADVVKVLQDAASGAAAAGIQGSSTACVVLVNQERGQLLAANLGDSGCLLLRPVEDGNAADQSAAPETALDDVAEYSAGASPPEAPAERWAHTVYEVKFRTNQLEHDFGRPYQLGHHANADTVDKCDVATRAVRRGDVLVLGTDGLLDNLSDVEIAEEVAACRGRGQGPSIIAQRLARLAFEASYDKGRVTPYAVAASEHFDMVYSGGKPDDITVLCAVCE
ncbi:hypothetical protein CHLRE_01g036200v5 [Chlamydomonas reinhardtii]|uniref:Protein phosphatase n=1 Tax=Chlamydomonas reinhardtii TaxID=3055 RepID=A0A2K3E749_CHLRE|nr:uncharacterized protein CHLRE_01g036200v5 [Chlamydomonas reinhardtii]PNW88593.1 hypothetical protein CHLRE_01g036200v5 [Chlamydomonas reinhardtii]